MSIFDFLFARAATPEQAQKNIFLDAIDGGGRFASGDDFRGGPLGISALLNALGVDPYGYSDAQPQAKPQGQAFAPRPPTGPARSLRPLLRGTQQKPDELLTERFGTQFALGTPSDVTTTALPPAPSYDAERMMRINEIPVAAPMGTTFGNLGNPIDETALNLLAPQVAEEVTAAQPVDYLSTAMQYPEFQRYVDAMAHRDFTRNQLARMFLNIAEGTASSVSASPLAMSAAPAALSSSFVGTSGSLPVLSNDGPTNTTSLLRTAGSQQYSMPTVPNDAPTSDNPNLHPESEIQRFMRDHDMTRETAIMSLDASVQYEREVREALRNALQGN